MLLVCRRNEALRGIIEGFVEERQVEKRDGKGVNGGGKSNMHFTEGDSGKAKGSRGGARVGAGRKRKSDGD